MAFLFSYGIRIVYQSQLSAELPRVFSLEVSQFRSSSYRLPKTDEVRFHTSLSHSVTRVGVVDTTGRAGIHRDTPGVLERFSARTSRRRPGRRR